MKLAEPVDLLQVVDPGGDSSVLAADYKDWKTEGDERGQVGTSVANKCTLCSWAWLVLFSVTGQLGSSDGILASPCHDGRDQLTESAQPPARKVFLLAV